MNKRSKSAGMTLIEMLLVIAIIGLIIAYASRNLSPAMGKKNIQEAKTQISMIDSAANSYAENRVEQFTNVSIEILTENELLDKSFGDGTAENPWGGDFTIGVGPNIYQYVITLTGVDADACATLADDYSEVGATCAGGTVTINRG